MSFIDEHTSEQIARANASGRPPVVFIHGLWLLAAAGTAGGWSSTRRPTLRSLAGWPDDPDTVEAANEEPDVFAVKTIGQVADHYAEVIAALMRNRQSSGTPSGACSRRSWWAGGLSAASVAIDTAPFRGVLPLPISSLRAAKPVLGNPANRHRAVPLTYDQFRFHVRQRSE